MQIMIKVRSGTCISSSNKLPRDVSGFWFTSKSVIKKQHLCD